MSYFLIVYSTFIPELNLSHPSLKELEILLNPCFKLEEHTQRGVSRIETELRRLRL